MKKRTFLKAILVVGGTGSIYLAARNLLPFGKTISQHRLYPFIKPYTIWTQTDFELFLINLDDDQKNNILSALEIKDQTFNVKEIKERLIWLSTHIVSYPFKDKSYVDYSGLVRWVAKEQNGIDNLPPTASTFEMERVVLENVFVRMWDHLTPEKRMQLIEQIDQKNQIKDRTALAALSGSLALASLSTTVYFSGFAFYTTMSIAICTIAGFFGVTLPFAAYTGASAITAIVSGPIGWTLIAIGALAGGLMLGAPSASKLGPFICQMHMIKADVLRQQGQLDFTMQILATKK